MSSLDTPLARLLHARGRVPVDALRGALEEARAERPDGSTLGARLVARGLVSAAEVEALEREAQGGLAQAARAPWAPGAIVGEHRLGRRLGKGGMGEVHEATHLVTGAVHAIKSLPGTADPGLLLRFQREVEALARVDNHPHVIRVHGAGEALGRRYLVMDLAPGGDLASRLDRSGPLPPADVVALGVALASGLAHVHRHGVLHRDLKPHNVLFDATGAPRLVDLGLARDVDARSLTATGEVIGTPAYMAPEQASGARADVGPATDVYGLAATLFHALTGQPPFRGASVMAVLTQVLRDPAPSARALAPGVPPALDAVLRRAMARAPADRYPTADAFGQALAASLATPARSGAALAALAGAALVAVVVGAGLVGTRAPGGPTATPPAPTPPPRPPSVRDPAPAPPGPGQAPAPEVDPLACVADVSTAVPAWAAAVPGLDRLWLDGQGQSADDQLSIARFFEGHVVPEAHAAAASWRKRVANRPPAEAGSPEGLLERARQGRAWAALALQFRRGDGVPLDMKATATCLARAAALDDPEAGVLLAEAHLEGYYGLAPDPERAAALLRGLWAALTLEHSLRDDVALRSLRDDVARLAATALPDVADEARLALQGLVVSALDRAGARRDEDDVQLRRAGIRLALGRSLLRLPGSDPEPGLRAAADAADLAEDVVTEPPLARRVAAEALGVLAVHGPAPAREAARARLAKLGTLDASLALAALDLGSSDPGARARSVAALERLALEDEAVHGDVVHRARVLLLESGPAPADGRRGEVDPVQVARRSAQAGWPPAQRALLRRGLPLLGPTQPPRSARPAPPARERAR